MKKVGLIIFLILVSFLLGNNIYSQTPISSNIIGQNSWMPSFRSGKFEILAPKLQAAEIKMIRIGGINYNNAVGTNSGLTNAQYDLLITSIKGAGAEPIVQLSNLLSYQSAKDLVYYLNVTKNYNIKYWSIGNEPDLSGLTSTQVKTYITTISPAIRDVSSNAIIFGPECAWMNGGIYGNMLDDLIGGSADITGKDSNGRYYIDVVSYHSYDQYSITAIEDRIKALQVILTNANGSRTGSPLTWAFTEFNTTSNNDKVDLPADFKVWTMYAGQFMAEVYGLCMKYKALTLNSWSTHESGGARTAGDKGLFDGDTPATFTGRSNYYHTMMLGKFIKSNYMNNVSSNLGTVKVICSYDSTGYQVLILNYDSTQYDFALRLNNGTITNNTKPLQIKLSDGTTNVEYLGNVDSYGSRLLVFDANGNLLTDWSYSKTQSDAKQEPIDYTPTITASLSSLSGFSYNLGFGPSAGQSFAVNGNNLTNNLLVTPSTNYEISTDGGINYDSLSRIYIPSSGTVTNQIIFTRLKAGLTASAYSETITISSSGANTLPGILCSGSVLSGFYYYKGSGSLTAQSSWGTNTDGSGIAPANFTANNQKFIIRNTAAVTTDFAWTVSGTGSKISVGDVSSPAVALTIASGKAITGTIDVPAASSGSNSLVLKEATTLPTFGTLHSTSEVHLQAAIPSTVSITATFGRLFIDGNANITLSQNASNNLSAIIQTSFSVATGSTLYVQNSVNSYFYINTGGTVTINGTIKTSKPAGLVAFNVANILTGDASPILQFKDIEGANLVLTGSTIEFSRYLTPTQYIYPRLDYNNLTLSSISANTKTFSGATTISGKLTINVISSTITPLTAPLTILSSGSLTLTSGTLTTGGFLTLKSTSAGTAYVAPVLGAISGNVNVERYIPAGNRAYRLLSSPVTTTSFIKANWQEGGLNANPNPGYGTHITGTGGIANGFDATINNQASLFTHNNVSPAWTAATNTNSVLTAGSPYLIYVRGSRLETNIDGSLTNDATILRATGALKTGTVAVTNLNTNADGFSLIGNPYQAQVDMQAVLGASTNLNANYYYVLNPKLGTKGQYVAVDLITPANNIGDANKYLQPWQACFVKTITAAAATLSFTEANKSSASFQTSVFRIANTSSRIRLSLFDTSTLAQNGFALDGLLIAFDPSETNDVNQNDASKINNFDESMASSNGGKLLAIEKRTMPTDSDEIPLNISKYRGTSYTIKAEGTGLIGSTSYLFDQFANKTIEIPQDGSVNYEYTVDAAIPASIAADRFKLIYAKTLKTIDNAVTSFALYPNPSKTNSFSVVVPQSMSKVSLTVSNMLGQKLYSQNDLQSGTTVNVTASNVKTAGVYLVSLTSEGKTTTTKWIVE